MRKVTCLIVAAVGALTAIACSGSGCSKLDPIPGGFPSAQRTPNALQMRVSASGFDKVEANPALFAQQLLGPSLQFSPAPSCGSPAVCCTGGTPQTPCGPVQYDPNAKPGDDPRLVLTPAQGQSRIDVTMRARIKTLSDIPVSIAGANCLLKIDTAPGAFPDIQMDLPVSFVQDATAGTTRLETGSVTISRLASEDVSLSGAFACSLANLSISFYIGTLKAALEDTIKQQLQSTLCKKCPGGSVGECGPFASACTSNVCTESNGQCVQELGPNGRMAAAVLFGGAPPGSPGALDLYEVAGGYGTTNNGGNALGVLGGLLPGGTPHDLCGPDAVAPAATAIAQSAYFQGNTRPDTGQPFDVAMGIHKTQAERFSYAAYQGGVLCPTFDTHSISSLSSDALLGVAPSLDNTTRGNRPLWVGFRPQSPPGVTLGSNTFSSGGILTDPLLALTFKQAEIDVFAQVERQPIRVATVVADMQIPLGATSNAPGQLTFVQGTPATATNISVKNNAPLLETTAVLSGLAALVEDAIVPAMVESVGPIALPPVGGLAIQPTAITTVDNQSFIALFGNLAPPSSSSANASPIGSEPNPMSVPAPDFVRVVFLLIGALGLFIAARRRMAQAWGVLSFVIAATSLVGPAACGGGDDSSSTKKKKTDAGSDAKSDANVKDGGNTTDGSGGHPSDSGTDATPDGSPCVPSPCQSGDLVPALGAWNSVAKGTRTVIVTYDSKYGDAVLIDVLGNSQIWRVIDGVPNEPPTHDPKGYRGGVETAGTDVGAWPSVALAGDRVRVAYQDRDRGALRFAAEDANDAFSAHDIDAPSAAGVVAGGYASLALGTTPAVAYIATGVVGSNGIRNTELRFARAKIATPTQTSDWTTTTLATAPGSCSGVCGTTDVCIAPTSATESEHCVTPTNDCTTACGTGQACVGGTCRALVADALADLPQGTGLFAHLIALADGRFVIVHYDSAQSALIATIETAKDSGQFTDTVLDGGGAVDRGMWTAAVLDTVGVIQVAYTDALTHQIFALSFKPGSAPTTPELVDDGMRTGDRPHWIGGGLVAWLDGAAFRVAYQDAFGADVVVATRSAGTWTHSDLVTGATLDGFALAAPPVGAGPLVWDRLDPNDKASHALQIKDTP